jgi:hypothetical protein
VALKNLAAAAAIAGTNLSDFDCLVSARCFVPFIIAEGQPVGSI